MTKDSPQNAADGGSELTIDRHCALETQPSSAITDIVPSPVVHAALAAAAPSPVPAPNSQCRDSNAALAALHAPLPDASSLTMGTASAMMLRPPALAPGQALPAVSGAGPMSPMPCVPNMLGDDLDARLRAAFAMNFEAHRVQAARNVFWNQFLVAAAQHAHLQQAAVQQQQQQKQACAPEVKPTSPDRKAGAATTPARNARSPALSNKRPRENSEAQVRKGDAPNSPEPAAPRSDAAQRAEGSGRGQPLSGLAAGIYRELAFVQARRNAQTGSVSAAEGASGSSTMQTPPRRRAAAQAQTSAAKAAEAAGDASPPVAGAKRQAADTLATLHSILGVRSPSQPSSPAAADAAKRPSAPPPIAFASPIRGCIPDVPAKQPASARGTPTRPRSGTSSRITVKRNIPLPSKSRQGTTGGIAHNIAAHLGGGNSTVRSAAAGQDPAKSRISLAPPVETGRRARESGKRGKKASRADAGGHGACVGSVHGKVPAEALLPVPIYAPPFRPSAYPISIQGTLDDEFDDPDIDTPPQDMDDPSVCMLRGMLPGVNTHLREPVARSPEELRASKLAKDMVRVSNRLMVAHMTTMGLTHMEILLGLEAETMVTDLEDGNASLPDDDLTAISALPEYMRAQFSFWLRVALSKQPGDAQAARDVIELMHKMQSDELTPEKILDLKITFPVWGTCEAMEA